jgi:hypothetical protein
MVRLIPEGEKVERRTKRAPKNRGEGSFNRGPTEGRRKLKEGKKDRRRRV